MLGFLACIKGKAKGGNHGAGNCVGVQSVADNKAIRGA